MEENSNLSEYRYVEIVKEFRFEAAHRLPRVRPEHKCYRLHGHSYRFSVHLGGQADLESGWLCDFKDISDVVQVLVDTYLDHYYLNEVPGLENPTSENLSIWLWEKLKPQLKGLVQITVFETCTSKCIYRGNEKDLSPLKIH